MSNFSAVHGDALRLPIDSNSINLIVTHPPYMGLDTSRYGGSPTEQINYGTSKQVVKSMTKALKEMYRVLDSEGSLFIAVNTKGEFQSRLMLAAVDNAGFTFQGNIYQASYQYMYTDELLERIADNSVTTWMHFTKSAQCYANPYEIRKYSDPVWDLKFDNFDNPLEKVLEKELRILDVVNQEIPSRFIKMFSKQGHVVLDPFGGSGIVAVTAASLGRVGISVDISQKQVAAAKRRAKETLSPK
jgi:DNA modification methylase